MKNTAEFVYHATMLVLWLYRIGSQREFWLYTLSGVRTTLSPMDPLICCVTVFHTFPLMFCSLYLSFSLSGENLLTILQRHYYCIIFSCNFPFLLSFHSFWALIAVFPQFWPMLFPVCIYIHFINAQCAPMYMYSGFSTNLTCCFHLFKWTCIYKI